MKRNNVAAIILFLGGVCFIIAFIIHGGSMYMILGCLWIILGIIRIIKPSSRR